MKSSTATLILSMTFFLVWLFLTFNFEAKNTITRSDLIGQLSACHEINQKLLIKDKKHYGTTSTDNESNE